MVSQSQSWRLGGMVAFALVASFAAQAQTMYRCGATYQDRPCSGVDSRPVGNHVRQAAGQSMGTTSIDPACGARGAAAQKLMWEKESGRTLDEQLAKPGADANLARNVYGRRGSSLEVRQAIETDCVKDLERANDAAALLKAATKASRSDMPSTGGQASTPSVGLGLAMPPAAAPKDDVARTAALKATTCSAVTLELNELTQAQRAGGDAARMDVLAARVRDAQSRKRVAGC